MGNSSSAKNRHTSGDDTAPTLTAGRMGDSSMVVDDVDMYDSGIGSYKSRPQPMAPPRGRTADSRGLFCGLDLSPRGKRLYVSGKASWSYFGDLPRSDIPRPRERIRSSTISAGEPSYSTLGQALPTVIKWEGGGKDVSISGSFNNWKCKIPLVKSHGDFYTIVDLPEGDHEYKFYVDGQWIHNPNEPTSNNDVGSLNNVVKVKKTDFEVFEALAIDSRTTNTSRKHQETPESGSPPTSDYGQDIPVRRTDVKQHGPPILPPQLLQVILNKDTPAHCEPTLLPEPNHVMLNHLYALSIKDGVMVLSATHRFRKKYVTTLLYKPI